MRSTFFSHLILAVLKRGSSTINRCMCFISCTKAGFAFYYRIMPPIFMKYWIIGGNSTLHSVYTARKQGRLIICGIPLLLHNWKDIYNLRLEAFKSVDDEVFRVILKCVKIIWYLFRLGNFFNVVVTKGGP